MSPAWLIDELKKQIEEELEPYRYENSNGEKQSIKVYYDMSDEEFLDEKHYPLIMVNLVSVTDTATTSIATVEITIGTYGETETSYLELLNIAERLRQYFTRERVLNRKYVRGGNIESRFVSDNPYPFKFGYITVQYFINRS